MVAPLPVATVVATVLAALYLPRAHGFATAISPRVPGKKPTPRGGIHGVAAPPPLRPTPACLRQLRLSSSTDDLSEPSGDNADDDNDGVDVTVDTRLRRVRISRALGIDWGTDLSFSFVYVRALEPSGAAASSGEIEVGDQLCELMPVVSGDDGAAPINLIGAPFDEVMGAFAGLGRNVREVDLVLFRGTKEELKALCAGGAGAAEDEMITITVIQNKGSKDEAYRQIEAKAGCNVRQVLTDNQINVYQSLTRWTNCKGKQLCGTCIVNVAAGGRQTNRKSLDEGSTLRENPDSYRLSCVTFAYGDVTVETFPPIEAAQWTR